MVSVPGLVGREVSLCSPLLAGGPGVRGGGTKATMYRRWTEPDGQEGARQARLALRFVFPQEMEALLHCNGLKVVGRYGDWFSGPMTADSRTMMFVSAKDS